MCAEFFQSSRREAMSDSRAVDEKIASLADWRGQRLRQIRELIRAADPEVVEEIKWRKASNPLGVPTWSHDGIICTGESYKDKVKLTFARGAALQQSSNPFNGADTGATRRSIDIHEGDSIDEDAFKALIRAAVALNRGDAA